MNDVVNLKPRCLNCSDDVQHTAKLFKIACLAYSPSNVNYRDFQVGKDHLLTVRKFIVG